MENYFTLLRNIAFFFATLMLAKYFVFLLLAPMYPVKEKLRQLKIKLKFGANYHYQPKISVVIPAWNEEVGIIKTIHSVLKNSYPNKEIIVVNDGSTDNTDQVVKDYLALLEQKAPQLAQQVRYFAKPNGGKGTALNYGIQRARGEIILTVDADSVLAGDALANLVKYYADPQIHAVVGNVKVVDNDTVIGFIQKLEYLFGFYFKRAHAVMGAEYIFGGACASFRRSVFDTVGLYDTSNKTEDIEITLRVRAYGYKCTYAEDVVCYTEGASELMGLINQRLRWKKGRFDAFAKHRRLFFSKLPHHNKFLTWFILPYSLLGEFQLMFEPIALALLVTYSILSGDYLTLTLGLLFVSLMYLVQAVFVHKLIRPQWLVLFVVSWPLFYLLVVIEYFALIHSLRMILAGDDITWQNWQRKGVKLAV